MIQKLLILFFLLMFSIWSISQELDCKVQVITNTNTSSLNKSVFSSMERSISEFMNLRRWTDESYAPHQKITCYLTINITDAGSENAYVADVTLQLERPVFNTTYTSPLIRHKDVAVPFEYIQNQPIDYNDNNFISNLSASLAFYAHFFIATYNESFANKGGQLSFERCNTICNMVPANLSIAGNPVKGWQASQAMDISGQQTRVGLTLAMIGSSNDRFRNDVYRYHIEGIDLMESNSVQALNNIEAVLNDIYQIPSKQYIHKHFILTKVDEIINLFSSEPDIRKHTIADLINGIDPTVATKVSQGFGF